MVHEPSNPRLHLEQDPLAANNPYLHLPLMGHGSRDGEVYHTFKNGNKVVWRNCNYGWIWVTERPGFLIDPGPPKCKIKIPAKNRPKPQPKDRQLELPFPPDPSWNGKWHIYDHKLGQWVVLKPFSAPADQLTGEWVLGAD